MYRLGSLGDTVVALPCFHLAARMFPNAERRLLTNFPVHAKAPASAAVLGESGLVDGYMRYTVGTRNPFELLRLAAAIRSFNPDMLIYLAHIRPAKAVRRDRLFFRFAGVRRIVGIPADEDMKPRLDAATNIYESEAARLARMVSELGDAAGSDPANWNLLLTEAERQTAREALAPLDGKPLIVCGPGTKAQVKDWGRDNWQALLARLSGDYAGHALALVGAPSEAALADHAASGWRGPKVNLCATLSPREMAAVLESAQVFLGPDSGPMHVAAAVGVPCVIAFSAATLPGTWFPPGGRHELIYHRVSCHGCYLDQCVAEQRRCLTSITVEEMTAAVHRVLDAPLAAV
jgi:ADP-heptose:LPS heptosyltransferase